MPSNKPGPLSNEDKVYIERNCQLNTVPEISKSIRRSEKSIKDYINKNNLLMAVDEEMAPEDLDTIISLRKYPWWSSAKTQFTKVEIELFEKQWVRLYKQFDYDVLPSEEIQIKKFITLEILRDRALQKIRQIEVTLDSKSKELDSLRQQPREERDSDYMRSLTEEISSLRNIVPSTSSEVTKLIKEQNDIEKGLSASRNDRVKNIQDATKNWSNILRMLEDSSNRKKIGKHLEIMKVARDKEMLRLTKHHKYVDDTIDRPILSGKLEDLYEQENDDESDN